MDPSRRTAQLLEACRALTPWWHPFLVLACASGARWGEVVALERGDVDWTFGRLHIHRTWSEKGRRYEDCKDHEDRWVKLATPHAIEVLRAHCTTLDLEAAAGDWRPEARRLLFPTKRGRRVSSYSNWSTEVWRPLFAATKLPYRAPHAMRHSYATWLLEEGADLRYVKDQLGHASIEETEGTYGHLERGRHEARVDMSDYFGPVDVRQSASMASDRAGGAASGSWAGRSGKL